MRQGEFFEDVLPGDERDDDKGYPADCSEDAYAEDDGNPFEDSDEFRDVTVGVLQEVLNQVEERGGSDAEIVKPAQEGDGVRGDVDGRNAVDERKGSPDYGKGFPKRGIAVLVA